MHKSYMRPEISHTHKLTNYQVLSRVFIISRIIIHYNSIKSIIKAEELDNYSPREPPNFTGTSTGEPQI
jgi:hypothetical protein